MIPRRFVAACVAALAVVLSAPFAQQMVDAILSRWPGRFRAIALTATVVPIAAALLLAFRHIRDRRLLRHGALACSVLVAAAYVGASDLSAAETFHFLEYGIVALLFYRAFLPAGDLSVLLVPLLAGITTGVLDEWLQWFVPIRTGELRDVALNLIAVVCGLLFAVGVAPPVPFRPVLTRRSLPRTASAAAVALLAFVLFVQSVRMSHEIGDDEVGPFLSRYSAEELEAVRKEREERWRAAPPVVLRRLSREDQFLAEAISHVRRRNQAWGAGDMATAWRENRILERHYAPVLDTPSYLSVAGHRWPDAQRAEAAARAARPP